MWNSINEFFWPPYVTIHYSLIFLAKIALFSLRFFCHRTVSLGIVKTTLQNWGAKRNRGEFEDIIIVGLDDAGFENTFNFSTMISYVEIDALRDDNYRFAPDNVRVLLLAKLGA